mgnify:CR=1 FL=1
MLFFITISCGKKIEEANTSKATDDNQSIESTNHELKQELKDAIDSNDLSVLEQTLKKLTHINFYLKNGDTPLTYAIQYSNIKIIARLMELEHDINLQAQNSKTPLIYAVLKNDIRLVEHIIKNKKVDLDYKTTQNQTALYYAISAQYTHISILLISHGADLQTDSLYYDLARKHNLPEVVQLISKITSLNINDFNVDDINYLIRTGEEFQVLRFLMNTSTEFLSMIKVHNYLNTIIDLDNRYRALDLMQMFIKNGANIDLINNNEEPAISHALLNEKYDLFDLLMTYNPKTDIFGRSYKTPLIIALEQYNAEIVEKLYRKGSMTDYNYIDENGKEVEIIACESFPDIFLFNPEKKSAKAKIEDLLGCDKEEL